MSAKWLVLVAKRKCSPHSQNDVIDPNRSLDDAPPSFAERDVSALQSSRTNSTYDDGSVSDYHNELTNGYLAGRPVGLRRGGDVFQTRGGRLGIPLTDMLVALWAGPSPALPGERDAKGRDREALEPWGVAPSRDFCARAAPRGRPAV